MTETGLLLIHGPNKVIKQQFIRFDKKSEKYKPLPLGVHSNFQVQIDFTDTSAWKMIMFAIGFFLQPLWGVLSKLTNRVVSIGYEERKWK